MPIVTTRWQRDPPELEKEPYSNFPRGLLFLCGFRASARRFFFELFFFRFLAKKSLLRSAAVISRYSVSQ